jgi:hypothetical protein
MKSNTGLFLFVKPLEGNENFIILNFQTSISTNLWPYKPNYRFPQEDSTGTAGKT